jgi:hypothetical protein
MFKVYSNREIKYRELGELEIKGDSFLIKDVKSKPKGSMSDFISIGKLIEEEDEFGGHSEQKWHHFAYPKEFSLDGFKFKTTWYGQGNQTAIYSSFVVPKKFIDDGFNIAIIGTGQGGRGYQNNAITLILYPERLGKADTQG